MKICKAKEEDIQKISRLILNTLDRINSKDYKKRQLAIERKCHFVKELRKEIKKKIFFVILDGSLIIGVIQLDLDEKAIDRLFLRPKYLGKGLGRKLLIYAEDYAKKSGIRKIKLYPTEYALSFYKKAGYKIVRRFIGTKNGGYPVIEMEKRI